MHQVSQHAAEEQDPSVSSTTPLPLLQDVLPPHQAVHTPVDLPAAVALQLNRELSEWIAEREEEGDFFRELYADWLEAQEDVLEEPGAPEACTPETSSDDEDNPFRRLGSTDARPREEVSRQLLELH